LQSTSIADVIGGPGHDLVYLGNSSGSKYGVWLKNGEEDFLSFYHKDGFSTGKTTSDKALVPEILALDPFDKILDPIVEGLVNEKSVDCGDNTGIIYY